MIDRNDSGVCTNCIDIHGAPGYSGAADTDPRRDATGFDRDGASLSPASELIGRYMARPARYPDAADGRNDRARQGGL